MGEKELGEGNRVGSNWKFDEELDLLDEPNNARDGHCQLSLILKSPH